MADPAGALKWRIFRDETADFRHEMARLVGRGDADLARVEPQVREIVLAVHAEGDSALQRYTERFDGRRSHLVLKDYGGAAALARLPTVTREALELAVERVRTFHEHEREHGFQYVDDAGVTLGMRVRPLARVGVYAPGGKARYPSSVIMAVIPAAVAGVREIVLATLLTHDASDDAILAAAHLAGVEAILDAGGAQAVAAMAFGTESLRRVDKIVGPGNVYVACAKRLVYGAVDIDGLAGPSEILVLADDEADPRVVAADLISQAEHDEAAYPLLVCLSDLMAEAVGRELSAQLTTLPRAGIARSALETKGGAWVVGGRDRMAQVAEALAVEHVAFHMEDPESLLARIGNVGAAFLGPLTPEAAGDYLAGPSHVLPTGGSVRFGAPLGVYDFLARTSVIKYTPEALVRHAGAITALARLEGLEGHARAVEVRRAALASYGPNGPPGGRG